LVAGAARSRTRAEGGDCGEYAEMFPHSVSPPCRCRS
jgi:hypothetical protein